MRLKFMAKDLLGRNHDTNVSKDAANRRIVAEGLGEVKTISHGLHGFSVTLSFPVGSNLDDEETDPRKQQHRDPAARGELFQDEPEKYQA